MNHAIQLLMSEIRADMGMLGSNRLAELDPAMLVDLARRR